MGMTPIDDFELGPLDNPKGDWPDIGEPAHPRLTDITIAYGGEWYPLFGLYYRGYRLPSLGMCAVGIRAQFCTAKGFLLFTSHPSSWTSSFSVHIHYVPSNFSGMDWGALSGLEGIKSLHCLERLIYQPMPGYKAGVPGGPDPLQGVEVVDEANIDILIHLLGWFRVTLHEESPQRFLISTCHFEHLNSAWFHERYFHVRRRRER